MHLGMHPWTQLEILDHNADVGRELAVIKEPHQGKRAAQKKSHDRAWTKMPMKWAIRLVKKAKSDQAVVEVKGTGITLPEVRIADRIH